MMKMRAQINFLDEIRVDLFAGGGGASTGIELAAGRPVDIAINHDPAAISMHQSNHPFTEHLQTSVWDVDPEQVCAGRPVGLAWFSPDCTHFSKARGGKPVDKNIRSLSWVVVKWALSVRPRVMMMENVEEIKTWGPVVKEKVNGKTVFYPDPDRAGETFAAFIGVLTTGIPKNHPATKEICKYLELDKNSPETQRLIKGLGYKVEYRELVAADYGAPTTRKRFVLIARCDNKPICWPERTHAPRDSAEVKNGKCKPWRSAAEIIDWYTPMYSIFASKDEIKEKYGVKVIRPLADNTLRRIIKGVDKFTIKSGKPFLVECNHSGTGHISSVEKPIGTVTQKCTMGVCTSKIAPITLSNTCNSVGSMADSPVHTITTAGNQILTSVNLMSIGQTGGGDRLRNVREPVPTTVSKQEACLTASNLIQYHTEQTENVRANSIAEPLQTVDTSNRHGFVGVNLVEYYGNGNPLDLKEPMHTITSRDREAMTAAHIQKYFGGIIGSEAKEPLPTITAIDHNSLAAAHICKFKGTKENVNLGQSMQEPLQTITAHANSYALVEVKTVKYAPGTALGYWPQVRELLNKYCGYSLANDEILLLRISGAWYYIHDISMRMLTPRELYAAMGFPMDYNIEFNYNGQPFPKSQQVARCGNAVSPMMAKAVVQANFPEWNTIDITTMDQFEKAVAM